MKKIKIVKQFCFFYQKRLAQYRGGKQKILKRKTWFLGLNKMCYFLDLFSKTINCVRHTKNMCFAFSAVVPVIKIVSTVSLIYIFPSHKIMSLVLDHNTFFEISIIIFACISSILWNFQSIKFFFQMCFWGVFIIRGYK